jgi:5-methylcytosine-specific restriction endonuclease McrA
MVCYLCGRSIPYDTRTIHPLALTIDHVMPISAGGTDSEDNLRPAHRVCNEDKGDRLPYWWETRRAS